MIADWQTNRLYFSELLEKKYPDCCTNIIQVLQDLGIKPEFLKGTNDIWARDYMPVQISFDKYVEYRYDPDYLQGVRKGYRNLKSYPDVVCDWNKLPKTIKSDLIIDGGNIVKSENSIILTEKVIFENRLSKTEIVKRLCDTFLVEKVVLIPWYKKEIFGHSDGVLRFIENNTVLINEIEKSNQPLIRKIKANKIDIEWLEHSVSNKNNYLNWAYINFLQMDNALLVPKLMIEEDEQAFEHIRDIYKNRIPPHRILQVDVRKIVESGGGALNCISWTTKE